MSILSLFAGIFTVFASIAVAFTFTNCGEKMESNNSKTKATIVYLGLDGRPVEVKLDYEVKGSDVIVFGDTIIGPKSDLVNGNKFIVNFARPKGEVFDYKMNLENINGQQLIALQAVKESHTINWPGGIVPIEFKGPIRGAKSIISHIDSFNELMIEKNLRIKLVPRTNEDVYVVVKSEYDDCSASSGYSSFAVMNLGLGCDSKRVVHHEILHLLGIKHEQARSDRDDYIIIHEDNIIKGKSGNFVKIESSVNLTGYDFDSIMHYGGKAFSKNNQATITRRHSNEEILTTHELSVGDVAGLSELYGDESYIEVDKFFDNPLVLAMLGEEILTVEGGQTGGALLPIKDPLFEPAIIHDILTTGIVKPLGLPRGLIEGQQYIVNGFLSKVYKYTSGEICYVPDGHFKNVIEKPKSWIDHLLTNSNGQLVQCQIGVADIIKPPAGLSYNQQYIAKGFVSKVLKVTKEGVCQVPSDHFYEVKEISRSLIESLLDINGSNSPLTKCIMN